MTTATLNWMIDPICGWSYGALPLINAVEEKYAGLQRIHLGGLYIGNSRQSMTAALRERIVQYDHHIHQLTGVEFGSGYKDELLNDPELVLDSLPATHVLLTAKLYTDSKTVIALLNRIQAAYYQTGLNITHDSVLHGLVQNQGMDTKQWQTWFSQVGLTEINQEIATTRELMLKVAGQGFPTLVLEREKGDLVKIDVPTYYNQPQQFLEYLQTQFA